jgi:hypothetical protein
LYQIIALGFVILALLSGLLMYRSYHLNVMQLEAFQQKLAAAASGKQELTDRYYRWHALAAEQEAHTLSGLRADLAATNVIDNEAAARLLIAGATHYLHDEDRFQAWLNEQLQTIETPSSEWTRISLASGAQAINTGQWCLQIEQVADTWLLTSLTDCALATP